MSSDRFRLDLHHESWIGQAGDKQQRGCRRMVPEHGAPCGAESRQEGPVRQECGHFDDIGDIQSIGLEHGPKLAKAWAIWPSPVVGTDPSIAIPTWPEMISRRVAFSIEIACV